MPTEPDDSSGTVAELLHALGQGRVLLLEIVLEFNP